MITSAIIYLMSILLATIALVLPDLQVWPDKVLNGIGFFVDNIMSLNSLFFFVDNLLGAISFFLKFLTFFIIYKLSVKFINWIRGADSI